MSNIPRSKKIVAYTIRHAKPDVACPFAWPWSSRDAAHSPLLRGRERRAKNAIQRVARERLIGVVPRMMKSSQPSSLMKVGRSVLIDEIFGTIEGGEKGSIALARV